MRKIAGIPGVGAIRTLVISLKLDDAGVGRALAMTNQRIGALNVMTGTTGRSLKLLQAQLAIFGFTAAAVVTTSVRKFAEYNKEVNLASLATGELDKHVKQLSRNAMELGRAFNMSRIEAARLIRQVQQLGPVGGPEAANVLAQAAAAFSTASGGEANAADVATTLERLGKGTTKTLQDLILFEHAAPAFASAILVVGQSTAAGAPAVARFVEDLSVLGTVANFTANDIIALSGAFADLSETQRESVRSSLQRLFGQEFIENIGALSALTGKTTATLENLRKQDPAGLLMAIAEGLKQIPDGDAIRFLRQFGFENVRDSQTLGRFTANLERFIQLRGLVADELKLYSDGLSHELQLTKQADRMNEIASGSLRGLGAAFGELAINAGGFITAVLHPLIIGLKELVQVISGNPFLLGLVTFGGLFAAGKLMLSGGKALLASGAGRFFTQGIFGAAGGVGGGLAARNAIINAGFLTGMGPEKAAILGGAGRLGALGMGGFAARMAGSSVGQGILGALGGRAATVLLGPIGMVLSGLMMLAPALQSVSDWLERAGEMGGLFGVVLKTVAFVFKLAALAGNVLNKVIDGIVGIIKKIFEWIGKIPGVKQLIDGAHKGLDGLNNGLDEWNRNLTGDKPGVFAGGGKLPGQGAGGTQVSQTFNVYASDSGGAAVSALRDAAFAARMGVSPSTARINVRGA